MKSVAPPVVARGVLLIVEDEKTLRDAVARVAERIPLEVHTAGDYTTALALAQKHPPDQVLLDVHIPGGSGVDLIPPIRTINPQARIVIFTAYPSIAAAVGAVRLGAYDYLAKPTTTEQVMAAFGHVADPQPPTTTTTQPSPDPAAPMSLARARWEHIQRVLAECGGNISTAARQLGIQRQSLQRMLKKYPPP